MPSVDDETPPPPEREHDKPREREPRDTHREQDGLTEGIRQRLEHLVPEPVKKTFAAGMGAVFSTEEGIRKFARDVHLPDAVGSVTGYIADSADGAKDKVFEVIARETREFLSNLNVGEELAKLLTTLSFEIETEIRFIPNAERFVGAEPDVKASVRLKRADDKGDKGDKSDKSDNRDKADKSDKDGSKDDAGESRSRLRFWRRDDGSTAAPATADDERDGDDTLDKSLRPTYDRRLMRLAVVGIIAGGTAMPGCAQIAGIDVTSAADHSNVTLAFERVSIGATVVTGPQDLTAGTATYLVDSDSDPTGFERVPARLADGSTSTWTAKIEDGEPQALFTLPAQTTTNLYDLGRDVLGDLVAYEHPGATPGADDVMVDSTLAIPAWNGADTFELFIVGTWGSHGLPAPAMPDGTALAATFTYGSFAPAAGAKPLAAVSDADAVLALAHSPSGTLVGFYDQSGLASNAVTGTIAPVTLDTTAMAAIDQAAIGARFGAAVPVGGTPTIAWQVTAAPGSKVGDANGPRLDAGIVGGNDGMIASTFGNPFATTRMWPAVFGVTASSARTYMMNTGSGGSIVAVPLASSVSELTLASAADAALDAPLASGVTLAGTALASDGVMIAVDPAKPVALAFSTAGATPVLYEVAIDRLVPSPDGLLVDTVPVLTALALAPAFRFPPEKLVAGHTYALHVTCFVGGYPGAAVGDLRRRVLPVTAATLTAGVFTVAAP